MRKPVVLLLLSAAIAIPATAWSQSRPAQPQGQAPTVDDYVCTFSGQCSQPDQADDQQVPNDPATGRPRISATRGFALSGTNSNPTSAHRVGPPVRHRMARNLAERTSTSSSASSGAAAPMQPGAGTRLNLALTFVTGSADLTSAARAQADIFAQSLMRPQLVNMHFAIEGHTDNVGNRDRNMDLSQRRAQTVADYLMHAGVTADRITVRGYGPDRPLPGVRANNASNRRVEVVRIS